jgi:hypothetical protein
MIKDWKRSIGNYITNHTKEANLFKTDTETLKKTYYELLNSVKSDTDMK